MCINASTNGHLMIGDTLQYSWKYSEVGHIDIREASSQQIIYLLHLLLQ